jgi:acetyl esterase/lipase
MKTKYLLLLALVFLLEHTLLAAEPQFTRTEDVVYGRKFGTALTLDVFQPAEPNGVGILFMVSGGFYSSHEAINPGFFSPFLKRGYTVFAVVHGSQPRFVIEEITQDIHRAVRFVRHHAAKYGIDPDRLGITGASAGGHLSLTIGTQGSSGPDDSKDPIERQSSAVQAIACFFPPTDLLNWGKEGVDAVGVGPLSGFRGAFGSRSESAETRQAYGKEISPLYFLSSNLPPTLIIHGDADRLVPIQQAESFVKRAKELGAPHIKLITREGADHGWPGMLADIEIFADWFDEHLQKNAPLLIEGSTFQVNGQTARVVKLDTLPWVESEFTKRFRFDSVDNHKLKTLREQYQLESVIAEGTDEFDRQVRLLDWTHRQFRKFGRPSTEARGALEILDAIEHGHTFFCTQYAHVFVSAAASLGWADRVLALRRHQDKPGGGSTEHATTEIWSNQYRKWIMMDPTANMHIKKHGVPLNAYEIRQEWFHRNGEDLVFVIGKERKEYRKSGLPIFLGRFEGFGDLTVPSDELDKYGFIGYIPNTDLMDAGLDYGSMFIVQDELCEGTRWHKRTVPANPAVDPYFPINQASLSLIPETGQIKVVLKTLTPNFKSYEARLNGGEWKAAGATLPWRIKPGSNRLEARTINQFGLPGPISTVEIESL